MLIVKCLFLFSDFCGLVLFYGLKVMVSVLMALVFFVSVGLIKISVCFVLFKRKMGLNG